MWVKKLEGLKDTDETVQSVRYQSFRIRTGMKWSNRISSDSLMSLSTLLSIITVIGTSKFCLKKTFFNAQTWIYTNSHEYTN